MFLLNLRMVGNDILMAVQTLLHRRNPGKGGTVHVGVTELALDLLHPVMDPMAEGDGLFRADAQEKGKPEVRASSASTEQVSLDTLAGAIRREFFEQQRQRSERLGHPHVSRVLLQPQQVPVVDADDRRRKRQGPFQLTAGVDFHNRLQIQFSRTLVQQRCKRIRYRRKGQEHRFRPGFFRLIDLARRGEQILSQNGQLGRAGYLAQHLHAAPEVHGLGNHGQSAGPRFGKGCREPGRIPLPDQVPVPG